MKMMHLKRNSKIALYLFFIVPLGLLEHNACASAGALVARRFYHPHLIKNKQIPKKTNTNQAAIDPVKVNSAKNLIQAMCWEPLVLNILQIFNDIPEPVTGIMLDYYGDDVQRLSDIQREAPQEYWRSGDSWGYLPQFYYPVQELLISSDRTYVEAVFDKGTAKKYQEKKKENSEYKGSGSQKYWISKQEKPWFWGDDSQKGVVVTQFFGYIMGDPDPNEHHFTQDFSIQDRAESISDDKLLGVRVETDACEYYQPMSEAREQHPYKMFLSERFGAHTIKISIFMDMAVLLKAVLLTPNFLQILQAKDSMCVIS